MKKLLIALLLLAGCAGGGKTRTYGVCIDYYAYCAEEDYEYTCKGIAMEQSGFWCIQPNGVRVFIQGPAVVEEVWK